MTPDVQWVFDHAPSVVLHVLRVGAFLSVLPMFGSESSSRMVRMILGISLGAILWWTTGQSVEMPTHLLDLIVLSVREVVIGLMGGYAIYTMITILAIAGEVISHEMGFSMARVMNPATGTSSTAMAQLFEVMGFVLIFQLNLHHEILLVLHRTYELVPIGETFDYRVAYTHLADMVAQSLENGLRYAIPILGVMILLTVVLVILARAVQNINLMEFSFALRIMLALTSSIYFLGEGQPFVEQLFRQIIANASALFVGA